MAEGEVVITEYEKPWYKSKTIWTNIIAIIAVILAEYGINIPPEQYATIAAIIIAIINIILRGITKSKLSL